MSAPIWFTKLVNGNEKDYQAFLDARQEMFSIAATIVYQVNVSSHITYFTKHLNAHKGKVTKLDHVVLVLGEALDAIERADIRKPSEKNTRSLVKAMSGSMTDYRSDFPGRSGKVACLKIPRSSLSEESLKELNKYKDIRM